MSDYNINSKEYWNKRFKTDWDDFGGIQQTEFFAKLACDLFPEWFIRDIKMKEYSFCDMGCALGNGVDVLSKFLGIKVLGKDFSEEAIEKAKELYPNYEFEQADITNLRSDNQYDVVFCSNVLEHFSDPWNIAQNLASISIHYLVLLVPFREKLEIDEHVYKFDSNIIPLKIDKFNLIYSNSINGKKIANTYYPDQQILLIYSNRGEEHKITSLKDVSDGISKSDLIELEEEKNQLILQLEEEKTQVISQLEYENNQAIIRLEEEKNLLISQLEEEKNLLISQLEEEKNLLISQLEEEKNLHISQLDEGKKELINIQGEYESKIKLMGDKVKSLVEIKENQKKQIDDYNVKQTELYGKIDEHVKQIEELKKELANNIDIRTNLDNELNRLTNALFEKENIINKALMQSKNMTFSRLFKFVHFLNRFVYQGIKEGKLERKKFRKWVRNKLNGSGDADHRFHPLYSIINILELNQTNESFVAKISNQNYLSQIQDSELTRHLNNENKRLAAPFNSNSKEILKIREIIGERDYKGIIVYPHVVYWEPLQTPQQLLRAFAKEGWLCFFCEHPNKKDSFQEIETNLIITREKELLEALDDKEVTVLLTWIGSLSFVNRIKNKKIWYHILDKLDIFPYYSETYLKIHNDIVSAADYVSYVAKPLLKCIVNREETTYLPNGVTSNELLNQHDGYIPNDMMEIINKGNKIVGYYGYLAEWMDYDLIAEVAMLRPEYEFVFIGKEIHDTSKISSIPNVHLLGLKPFNELSDYAKFFDVATIPFVINEMMDCVSPIKFYEYCALGLPVVASYMVEVASFACEFVACFNNKDEYLYYLDKFVRNDIKQLAQKEAPYIAKDNTWTSRAQTMVEKFNKNQQTLLKSEYSNFDVIILSVIDFDFRYQRPQHFASRFAENGHRVFYINANHYNESSITEIEKNLYIVNFKNDDFTAIHLTDWKEQIEKLKDLIDKLLFDYCIRDAITIVDYPNWVLAAEYMRKNYGFKIVTDYMDDYTGFLNPAEKLVGKNCEKLLTISDAIVASSEFLFNIAIEYNKNVSIVRNGTEFEHFYESTNIQEVKERKIIGYYGAVAQWFDLDKVCYVADNLKECDIVIIGEITEGMNRLSKYPNIKLLGERPYSELPKHLANFDVCLIPFDTSTDLIKATNPVKFYEYLSAGKKVVATEIPELQPFKDKYVYMSNDNKTFLEYIKKCLDEVDTLADFDDCIQFGKDNDWQVRYQDFVNLCTNAVPKISIIVLTFNNLELNKLCIRSILEKTAYPNYELIVVDNKSTDGTNEYLKQLSQKDISKLKVIFSDTNSGFAGGNNLGIKNSNGDYVLLLNNDTIVTRGWLTSLVKHLENDNKLGMCGPVTNSIGNEAKIKVHYNSFSELDSFSYNYTWEQMNLKYENPNVLALFCTLIRRDVINKCGLLDENYGIGMFEDDDYAEAVKNAGYNLAIVEDSFIHHFEGSSFKKLDDVKFRGLFEKNKEIFEKKWKKKWAKHKMREGITWNTNLDINLFNSDDMNV